MKSSGTSVKRNALLNVIKQACTVIFPFFMFSYASHVLGAEKIGAYTFGQSVISYFACFAASGISDYAVREAAIVRENPGKLGKLADEVFSIQLFLSVFSYAVLFILLGLCGKLHPYQHMILIQSIQIFLSAVGADWVNTAFEDFSYLTVRYLVMASACTAAVFWFVKGPEDLYRYTWLSMMCAAGGNVWNIFYIRRYVKLGLTVHLNLKKHLPPMLMLFFNSIALVIYLNSDITILGMYAQDAAVGSYSVPTKIYLMAKSMINAVIMAAVPGLSHTAATKKTGDSSRMLSGMADLLCMLLIPAAAGIFCEAENLIWLAGGSGFLGGTTVLRIYSITIVPAVGACFFSYAVLVPLHMEKYFLLSTIMAAALNIGMNFCLIPRWGMSGAALTTLLAEFTVFIITAYFVKKAAGVNLYINKKDLYTDLAGGAAIGIVCIAMKQSGLSRALELGAAIAMSVVAYCGVLLAMKNQTFLMLWQSVHRRHDLQCACEKEERRKQENGKKGNRFLAAGYHGGRDSGSGRGTKERMDYDRTKD